jgi:hypothetical protein
VARTSTWDGVERRSGNDRRESEDRRAQPRSAWERRSGHDRRGHKLYAALIEIHTGMRLDEPERLDQTG